MRYHSVFGGERNISFRDALLNGFASDGSMIVPDTIPLLSNADLRSLAALSCAAADERDAGAIRRQRHGDARRVERHL
jgi:threonine synthase